MFTKFQTVEDSLENARWASRSFLVLIHVLTVTDAVDDRSSLAGTVVCSTEWTTPSWLTGCNIIDVCDGGCRAWFWKCILWDICCSYSILSASIGLLLSSATTDDVQLQWVDLSEEWFCDRAHSLFPPRSVSTGSRSTGTRSTTVHICCGII